MKGHPAVVEHLGGVSVKGLLRLYKGILEHLKQREICTTRDNPVGGYGEWLVARSFRGERLGNSSKSVDVLAADGTRLQVKTRWLAVERDSRHLGALRNLDKPGFDYLIAVFLGSDFDVAEAYQIPHAAVVRLAARAQHTNSHRLILTPKVCRDPECQDITERIQMAEAESL